MAFTGPQTLNAPPPSPATDPRAAGESSPINTMTGGQPPAAGATGQPTPQAGPDMSGILMLGQKVSEAMLTMAQALPAQAGLIDQARAMWENALAQWTQTAGSSPAGASGAPMSPPPGSVTQSGTQFPGGGFAAGKPF